jgi:hypothetical protein
MRLNRPANRAFFAVLGAYKLNLNTPANLTAATVADDIAINLNWTDNNTLEDGYRIYANTVNSKPASPWATVGANTTNYQLPGSYTMATNTLHYIWVEAYTGSLTSGSNTTSASTSNLNTPTELKVLPNGTNITITWKDNTAKEWAYKIYTNTVNTKPDSSGVINLSQNVTNYTISNLINNKTYYVWVAAYKNGCESVSATNYATTGFPSAYWKFNEASGSVLGDSSGNGNNGTISYATWTNGINGGGLYFNGSYSRVTNMYISNFPVGNSNYTIEAWVCVQPKNNNMDIIGWGYTNTNQYNLLTMNTNYIGNWWFYNSLTYGPTNISFVGSWYYMVATFDGTSRKLYCNAQLVKSDTPTGHNVMATNLSLGYGCYGAFWGVMDEVAVWKKALTLTEIQDHYSRQKSGN